MKITKACDYAIRALVEMSKKEQGTVFMRSELSKIIDVPDSFLGKILQNMAKAGLLESERGKKGGFRLEKDIKSISMYDVVTALEGEIFITDCLANKSYCTKSSYCKANRIWHEIQNNVIEKLSTTTIKDLS